MVCNLRLHADCEGPTPISYTAYLQHTYAKSQKKKALSLSRNLLFEIIFLSQIITEFDILGISIAILILILKLKLIVLIILNYRIMNFFEKAFHQQRTSNTRKRDLNQLEGVFDLKNSYLPYYFSATKAFEGNDKNSALAYMNETINRSDIDDWKHFALKAIILKDLEKYSDAIDNYKIAIDFNGEDNFLYAFYHEIGYCYLMLKNNLKAIEFITYAIDLKISINTLIPDNKVEGVILEYGLSNINLDMPLKRMYINRASSYLNINKLQNSFEDCKNALKYDQKYSNAYLCLSQIYGKAGDEEKCITFLRVAAHLGNVNAVSLLNELDL